MTSSTWTIGGRTAELFDDVSRWRRVEEEMDRDGLAVPLAYRSGWIRDVSRQEHRYLVVRDEADRRVSAAVALECIWTRALPGHLRLRAASFGATVSPEALPTTLQALQRAVVDDARVLEVQVEVLVADPDRRTQLERALSHAGYQPAKHQSRYRRTAALDLTPGEEELMSSFSRSCRRCIRDAAKKGYSVDVIDDARWAGRMDRLFHESFERTGSSPPERRWEDHVEYARAHQDTYRVVGMFGPGYPDEASLQAFCCARNNMDHAVYTDGASTRDTPGSVPLAYALMWDVIRWAKARGCAWLDMGGITEGGLEDEDDARGGISDFKRRFTNRIVELGGAWEFKPSSWRATAADGVSSVASLARRLIGRRA